MAPEDRLFAENLNLVRHLVSQCRGRLEAEDAYQEGCLALLRAARAYRPNRGAFGPYAARAIRNALHNARQRSHAWAAHECSLGELLADEEGGDPAETICDARAVDPESEVLRRETRRELEAALGLLRPAHATVIRLRYGLDDGVPLTCEETAQRLKTGKRTTVHRKEQSALRRLRSGLVLRNPEKQGVPPERW